MRRDFFSCRVCSAHISLPARCIIYCPHHQPRCTQQPSANLLPTNGGGGESQAPRPSGPVTQATFIGNSERPPPPSHDVSKLSFHLHSSMRRFFNQQPRRAALMMGNNAPAAGRDHYEMTADQDESHPSDDNLSRVPTAAGDRSVQSPPPTSGSRFFPEPTRVQTAPMIHQPPTTQHGLAAPAAPAVDDDGGGRVPRVEFVSRPSGDLGSRIEAKYQLLHVLGTGGSGTVYLVRSKTPDQATGGFPMLACKQFKYQDSDITASNPGATSLSVIKQDAMNELEVMRLLHHPNLLRLVDAFVGNTSCLLVTELARAGDLLKELKKRRRFVEEDAKAAITGVLDGLSYLHGKGIAHRDLKLENILLTGTTRDDLRAAKIADFAMAKNLQGLAASKHTICGTPLTMAPEVLVPVRSDGGARRLSRYGVKADVWSCGVILYCLLSGVPPYKCARGGGGRTACLAELFAEILTAEIEFSHPGWWGVSAEAKDLVSKLLVRSPEERLTAEEALRHPWLTRCTAATPSSPLQ